jgi:hypothetical protein
MRSCKGPAGGSFLPQNRTLLLALAIMTATHPARAIAQQAPRSAADEQLQQARNSSGIMVGEWHVPAPTTTGATYKSSLLFTAVTQRGLNTHVALESSAGLWRRVGTTPQAAGKPVITKSYLIPLLDCLKLYPFTRASNRIEPYLVGGLGFALGIQQHSTNAIGGGGTDVVTGFAVKIGAGVEYHMTRRLGLLADGRYLWLNLSDRISDQSALTGGGVEAGMTYKLTK